MDLDNVTRRGAYLIDHDTSAIVHAPSGIGDYFTGVLMVLVSGGRYSQIFIGTSAIKKRNKYYGTWTAWT